MRVDYGIFGVYKERYISMDAQGRTVTFERRSFNSSNDAVNNNELPRQDCTASDCMDYAYTDNNNMTSYGSGHGDFLPNLHHHMTAGGSSSSYERAAGDHAPAGAEGPSGGTGRPSQASPSEPAIPSFFTVSDREEPMPQAPSVHNVNEQPANPRNDNVIPHPQLHAQQRFCNFLREMREDLERTLETLDALENIRCPLLSEDDDERVGTEDDADDEDDIEDGDEDDAEDEDMNVGEDDDLVGVHFPDDDDFNDVEEEEEEEEEDDDDGDEEEAEGQNGNEELGVMQEAPGNINDNVNVGPIANNVVAMQPEEGDGLDVEEILAALGMEVYESQSQPQPDELHPHLVDAHPSSCSICLEDFEQGELLGILECEHRFHYTCIQEWLRRKNSCPLCRNIGLAV